MAPLDTAVAEKTVVSGARNVCSILVRRALPNCCTIFRWTSTRLHDSLVYVLYILHLRPSESTCSSFVYVFCIIIFPSTCIMQPPSSFKHFSPALAGAYGLWDPQGRPGCRLSTSAPPLWVALITLLGFACPHCSPEFIYKVALH